MKYMQVKLTEISKAKYYAARSDDKAIEAQRPLGFITKADGVRTLYLSDGGKFYCGELMPWQTGQMFMSMEFREIQNFLAAQFIVPDAA